MEWQQLLLAAAVILLTHFIGAITAYGSTLMALPLLVWVLNDLPTTVFTLLVIGTVQAVQIFAYTRYEVDYAQWRRFLLYTGGALPIGFLAAGVLPQRILLTSLALVLVMSGLSRLQSGRGGQEKTPPSWLLNVLLVVGGIIHGVFASGGATLVVVGQYALPVKQTFRATLSLVWIVLNGVMIIAVLGRGQIGAEAGVLLLLGLPLVFLANIGGERVARRLPQQQFARLVAVLLVLAGIVLLARTLRPQAAPVKPQVTAWEALSSQGNQS